MSAYKTQNFCQSADEALAIACKDLVEHGQEVSIETSEQGVQKTVELMNYCIGFMPWHDVVIHNPIRKFPVKGSQAEFLWYMTANNRAESVAKYLPNWNRFANDGIVNSNYGVYWRRSIKYVLEELRRDKYSRRAIINIFQNDKAPFGKDTPCTLSLQFLIRNNQLHLIVNMRSNDVWYGFGIDQYTFSLLHRLVFNTLQETYPSLGLGWYQHNAGSFHAYDNTAPVAKMTEAIDWYDNLIDKASIDRQNFMLAGVTFDTFWTAGEPYFNKEIFDYFRNIAIQNNCTDLSI